MNLARHSFRVIELDDGRWACRRGLQELDIHAHVDAAVDHIIAIAAQHSPSQVIAHHLDGRVRHLHILDRPEVAAAGE